MNNHFKNSFLFPLLTVILSAMPLCVQADVLINGGYNWGDLDFNDPNNTNTTSYVIADYRVNQPNIDDTSGITNNSRLTRPVGDGTGTAGRQRFDAEKMYLQLEYNTATNDKTLYIAIVTGLDPSDDYAAGDILFDFIGNTSTANGDMTDPVTGALVPGNSFKKDNNTPRGQDTNQADILTKANKNINGYEYGLVTKGHGQTKALSGTEVYDFGYTASAGDIFSLESWNSGSNKFKRLHPATGRVANGTATLASTANNTTTIQYGIGTTDPAVNEHYVIEASIDLNNSGSFGTDLINSVVNGSTGTINVHWNPINNNDWIQYTGSLIVNSVTVAEPSTLLIMLLGVLGLAYRKKIPSLYCF